MLMRWLGRLICASICATSLALIAPLLSHAPGDITSARACGIGFTVTMVANDQAALAYPQTAGQGNTPIGLFALAYAVNASIHFTEDVSRLPTPIQVNAFIWHWDFGDGSQGTGYMVQHSYAQPGTFTVHVKVQSNPTQHLADLSDFDSAQVTVGAQTFTQLPTVTASSSTRYVQVQHAVTYAVTSGRSLVGGSLTYTWNFGDGATATGAKVTHTFTQLGDGAVALIAQDRRGARSYTTLPVTIVAQVPIVHLSASSRQVTVQNTINFDATGSTAPTDYPNNRLTRYQWDFGDGTTQTTIAPTVRHTYTSTGAYTITVQALDRRDIPGSTMLIVTVTNPPLVQALWWFSILLIGGSVVYLLALLGRRMLRGRGAKA